MCKNSTTSTKMFNNYTHDSNQICTYVYMYFSCFYQTSGKKGYLNRQTRYHPVSNLKRIEKRNSTLVAACGECIPPTPILSNAGMREAR